MPDDSGDPVRVERYVEEVVPMYSDGTFKSHFRMHWSTFEDLCKTVGPLMVKERYLTVEKRLLATVWLLSNQESYRGVADRFGLSKGTLHLTVMANAYFPGTMQAMKEVAEGFMARCGFPGVVGAIDGTHIPIPAPTTEHRAFFINRKGFSSMVLQVVCDSNLKFLDVFTGWPGSVHDARVFRNSPVREQINNLPEEFHVLGDSAYPLSKHVLVPYRDNGHLNNTEKKFNKCHSSTRVDVERSIGLLKCKFRRMKYLDMQKAEEIPVVISSCCVLHNFILDHEHDSDIVADTTDDVVEEQAYDG
ncbi:HARB1-like protein, partial [Mya arenaria]